MRARSWIDPASIAPHTAINTLKTFRSLVVLSVLSTFVPGPLVAKDDTSVLSASGAPIAIADLRARFEEHCFACHGDGAEEGGLSFEKLVDGGYGDRTNDRWEAVWKNIRSQTMPPADESQPEPSARDEWTNWITSNVFRLSGDAINPGKVVLRRLNRTEYQESVSLLTGVNFDVNENFPADDTGYGFDTIGEVLQMSPVLVEKYVAAAEQIVSETIPMDGPSAPEKRYWSDHFSFGSPRWQKSEFGKTRTRR